MREDLAALRRDYTTAGLSEDDLAPTWHEQFDRWFTEAQGLRLGRALTDLGLAHLRSRGLAQVLLYVEEDNAAAVRLYEGRGFTRYAVDVSWHRPGS